MFLKISNFNQPNTGYKNQRETLNIFFYIKPALKNIKKKKKVSRCLAKLITSSPINIFSSRLDGTLKHTVNP